MIAYTNAIDNILHSCENNIHNLFQPKGIDFRLVDEEDYQYIMENKKECENFLSKKLEISIKIHKEDKDGNFITIKGEHHGGKLR